jgi:hypothetical protein
VARAHKSRVRLSPTIPASDPRREMMSPVERTPVSLTCATADRRHVLDLEQSHRRHAPDRPAHLDRSRLLRSVPVRLSPTIPASDPRREMMSPVERTPVSLTCATAVFEEGYGKRTGLATRTRVLTLITAPTGHRMARPARSVDQGKINLATEATAPRAKKVASKTAAVGIEIGRLFAWPEIASGTANEPD